MGSVKWKLRFGVVVTRIWELSKITKCDVELCFWCPDDQILGLPKYRKPAADSQVFVSC